MANQSHLSRRRFLGGAVAAVTVLSASQLAIHPVRSARADLPEAEEGHAHDYVHDAADAAEHDAYAEGQNCENCAFWTGEERNGWGGCAHPDFEGVVVNAEGWCSAYAPAG